MGEGPAGEAGPGLAAEAPAKGTLLDVVIERCREASFTGVAYVRGESGVGQVFFISGLIDVVRFGRLNTEAALAELRSWRGASLEVHQQLPSLKRDSLDTVPFRGTLVSRPPFELLRFCEDRALTCVVELRSGESSGEAVYVLGDLQRLHCEGSTDEGAVTAMLSWARGTYRIALPPVTLPPEVPVHLLGQGAPEALPATTRMPSIAPEPLSAEEERRRQAEIARMAESARRANEARRRVPLPPNAFDTVPSINVAPPVAGHAPERATPSPARADSPKRPAPRVEPLATVEESPPPTRVVLSPFIEEPAPETRVGPPPSAYLRLGSLAESENESEPPPTPRVAGPAASEPRAPLPAAPARERATPGTSQPPEAPKAAGGPRPGEGDEDDVEELDVPMQSVRAKAPPRAPAPPPPAPRRRTMPPAGGTPGASSPPRPPSVWPVAAPVSPGSEPSLPVETPAPPPVVNVPSLPAATPTPHSAATVPSIRAASDVFPPQSEPLAPSTPPAVLTPEARVEGSLSSEADKPPPSSKAPLSLSSLSVRVEVERQREEAARAAAEARRAEAERRADLAWKAELERRSEAERRAEAAVRAEAERRAEAEQRVATMRRVEAERRAEVARKAEAARKAEQERRAEIERRFEAALQAEQERQAEAERKIESVLQAEEVRRRESERRAEASRTTEGVRRVDAERRVEALRAARPYKGDLERRLRPLTFRRGLQVVGALGRPDALKGRRSGLSTATNTTNGAVKRHLIKG